MNTYDFLRIAASVVGILISLPLLIALVRAAVFFGSMSRTVEQIGESLQSFVASTNARFAALENTQGDHGEKIAVLWDGHERRTGSDRRHGA